MHETLDARAADRSAATTASTTPVTLWLLLRLLTYGAAVLVASLRPAATLRDRLLTRPFQHWDTSAYIWIVRDGYRLDNGSAQFHPLYPWLSAPLAALTADPLLGLVLTASLCCLALTLAFERLALLDLSPERARAATLLLLCAPPAIAIWLPYTEALFLLCTVLCLLWARQRRWWLAGLAGALATLTRQQGLFLLVPLAVEIISPAFNFQSLKPQRAPFKFQRATLKPWLALLLIPCGLLVWIGYRALVLGDVRPNTTSLNALIYSLLISPSSAKIVPDQAFLFPPYVLWLAIRDVITTGDLVTLQDLVIGAVILLLVALAWPQLQPSYKAYTAVTVLVSFGYYTGPSYPYMGLGRHLLLAVPIGIGLAARWNPLTARRVALFAGLPAMLYLLFCYIFESWVL